jgi:hypothetical protein
MRMARSVPLAAVRITLLTAAVVASPTQPVAGQDEPQMDVGAHLLFARSSEFEETSIGVSGRVGWRPMPLLGLEAEIGVYPSEFPDDLAFSSGQVEGLFGVTTGPSYGAMRLFAKARAGFLTFRESSRPIACLAIFPPPLSCTLAAGRTLPAIEVGGGAEMDLTRRTFVRVDAGDRMAKYPGPVFRRRRSVTAGFWGHDFRVSVGGGLRF